MELGDEIRRLLEPLRRRISLLISRAVVILVNDLTGNQSLQCSVLSAELQSEVERIQNYGFTSVPLPGAEAVLIFPNGNRDHAIAVAVDNRLTRKKLMVPGDVALYDMVDNFVWLSRTGLLLKHAAKVMVTTPELDVVAAQIKLGAVATDGVTLGETFMALFNAHTHVGNLGSPTSPPVVPMTAAQISQTVKVQH